MAIPNHLYMVFPDADTTTCSVEQPLAAYQVLDSRDPQQAMDTGLEVFYSQLEKFEEDRGSLRRETDRTYTILQTQWPGGVVTYAFDGGYYQGGQTQNCGAPPLARFLKSLRTDAPSRGSRTDVTYPAVHTTVSQRRGLYCTTERFDRRGRRSQSVEKGISDLAQASIMHGSNMCISLCGGYEWEAPLDFSVPNDPGFCTHRGPNTAPWVLKVEAAMETAGHTAWATPG